MSTTRNACLIYLPSRYPTWPKPSDTGHPQISHYGYAWTLKGKWYLKHDETGDEIHQHDVYPSAAEPAGVAQEIEFKYHLPALPAECDSVLPDHVVQYYLDFDLATVHFMPASSQEPETLMFIEYLTPPMLRLRFSFNADLLDKLKPHLIAFAGDNKKVCYALPNNPVRFSLRLRTTTPPGQPARHMLTLKVEQPVVGHGLPVRLEFNLPVHPDKKYFIKQWQRKNTHLRIEKHRYRIAHAGEQGVWEVDDISHPVSMCLAEYETPDPLLDRPTPPAHWHARDVSDDPNFTNAVIAQSEKGVN